MLSFPNLLVVLNLNEGDSVLLRYAAMVARLGGAHNAHVVFVDDTLGSLKNLKDRVAGLLEEIQRTQLARLEQTVREQYDGPGTVHLHRLEGSPAAEILKLAQTEQADLILVGRDTPAPGAPGLSGKLARKAPCSVWMVPGQTVQRLDSVLVPVDFSEPSREAVAAARALVQARGLSSLACLHAYIVPPGYDQTGLAEDRLLDIVRTQAEAELREFLASIDASGLDLRPRLKLDEDPVHAILETASEEHADLIVMGSHGRTALSLVLLGGVTEGVLGRANLPVLVIKNRERSARVLKALQHG